MVAETRQAGDKRTKRLLHYLVLNLAMNPKIRQEAAVGNFAAELLRGLEYDDENRIAFIRHPIHFLIYGENTVAQTDEHERSGTLYCRRGYWGLCAKQSDSRT
jgi:hypothetical protein